MSEPEAPPQNPTRAVSEASTRPALRTLAPRPPQGRSLIVPSSLPYRANRPLLCPVCSRRGCQLQTHKALASRASRRGSLAPPEDGPATSSAAQSERLRLSAYTKSYAYLYTQGYVDTDISASKIDPFFDLPLPSGVNKPEMHMLFHKYFAVESNRSIHIPRPPELPTDVVLSPFFLPAMTDSALCLAILTASAALLPERSGRAAENVAVLTLFDQAMYQLRERLASSSGEVSDATVVAATFLWGINALLNDPHSMQQHGKSVHALVSGRGGLSNLGLSGAVARFVVMVDSLNAIIFAERPQYANKVSPMSLEDEPLQACGVYLSGRKSQQSLDPELHKLCRECVGIANLLEQMIHKQPTTQQYFYALSKLSSIGTQTIIIYVRLKETGSKSECACLATQLMNILLYYMPREQQMLVVTQAGRLIRALQQQEIPTYWLGDMELLVWILFILAMLPHDFDGKEWAMDLLCQALCSRFGSEEWPEDWEKTINEVVLQFIWSDTRLAASFATICRSVMLRVFGDEEIE